MRNADDRIRWQPRPEPHDYTAALSYLTLFFPEAEARRLVARLRRAKASAYHAKDILRASGLPLLDGDNAHVDRDRRKIAQGDRLSPILLVRDRPRGRVIVADGYHRMCAVYSYDEDAMIPCRIA